MIDRKCSTENKAGTVGKKDYISVKVIKEHHIAEARQAAKALAESMGLSLRSTFFVATSVSELANNLFFHAVCGGTITISALSRENNTGIEIISEDDGPGISDINLALQDGFSTNGGLGGGLPGVKRLMDEFNIFTKAGGKTRIVARKWKLCR